MFTFKSKFLQAANKPKSVTAEDGGSFGTEELNGFTVIPLDNFVKSGSAKKSKWEPEPKYVFLDALEETQKRLTSLLTGKGEERITSEIYSAAAPFRQLFTVEKIRAQFGEQAASLFVQAQQSFKKLEANGYSLSPMVAHEIRHASGIVKGLMGIADAVPDRVPKEGSVKTADDEEIERDEPATKEIKPAEKPEPKKEETKKPEEEEQEFGLGAKTRPLSDEEMQDYAGRIKTQEKTKLDPYTMPYVHGSNIKIVDGTNNEYDIAALKAAVTKRPSTILKQNEKMQHSDGHTTQFFNVGLPALKGLAVNEKTGEFVVVDTCPGSGSCKTFCYAMKGSYVMFKDTSLLQTQTLNFLLNDPKGFETRLKADIAKAIKNKSKDGTEVVIRWHDAGDFFSPQYMKLAFNVASAFPNNDFYAYTKMAAVANATKPSNFIINFSEGALPRENKQVQLTQIKHSVVVQKELFYDLIARKGRIIIKSKDGQTQFKDKAAWDEFKDRLVAKYHINKDTILSFNEYMDMKKRDKLGEQQLRWNVVVPPGGGDNSANDPLVLGTYLMFH